MYSLILCIFNAILYFKISQILNVQRFVTYLTHARGALYKTIHIHIKSCTFICSLEQMQEIFQKWSNFNKLIKIHGENPSFSLLNI